MIQEAYLGDYRHTRDPKVWKKQDGKYAMVIGSKIAYEDDYCGKALFYESEDGIKSVDYTSLMMLELQRLRNEIKELKATM